ncbi:PP0621 family protein [Burkholderia sp. LMU1-1-1.1]|uniref:PP0621 family protein n=1 Tax=Burkholderia sp. LMU1-1-1.1 TaxID=3135266 RepID=UPI00344AF236
MSRILFWLGLIFLVIFAIRSKIRSAQKRNQQQFRQPPPNQEVPPGQGGGQTIYKARTEKALADAETMLECAKCGIFFPASEAVHAKGRDYCCAAHAAAPAA